MGAEKVASSILASFNFILFILFFVCVGGALKQLTVAAEKGMGGGGNLRCIRYSIENQIFVYLRKHKLSTYIHQTLKFTDKLSKFIIRSFEKKKYKSRCQHTCHIKRR